MKNKANNQFEILGIIVKPYPTEHSNYSSILAFTRARYFDFKKNLVDNTVYSLNSNFKIEYDSKNETVLIDKNPDIFEFNIYSSENSPNIQINAIVGKNGSGKSTFTEILFLMLYNLAVENDLIEKVPSSELQGFLNSLLVIKRGNKCTVIDFEILNQNVYVPSKNDSKNIRFFEGEFEKQTCLINFSEASNSEKLDLKELFYAITLNYSAYGLNEYKMGKWIHSIFHKNDMYQTPIVINPKREQGNIDVNVEDEQNKARLILNLAQRGEGSLVNSDFRLKHFNYIYDTNNRFTVRLSAELKELTTKPSFYSHQEYTEYDPLAFINKHDYTSTTIESHPFDTQQVTISSKGDADTLFYNEFVFLLMKTSLEQIKLIHTYFDEIKSQSDLISICSNLGLDYYSNNQFCDILLKDLFGYFIYKLFRVGINYPKEFGGLINKEKNGFSNLDTFKIYLLKVLESNSHACFKLKRTYYFINLLKGKYSLQLTFNTENHGKIFKFNFDLDNEKLVFNDSRIQELKKVKSFLYSEIDTPIWKIPPPIFVFNCILQKKDETNDGIDLQNLSSGETQLIYSIQTIIYHLINLESNFLIPQTNENFLKYKNVLIILDEIELYYHPDYQRQFISTLIQQIKELSLEHIKNIQIIFSTHSPFILSDIPSSNILKLKDGLPELENNQTFGANIHDLLANDFFLKEGFMGKFAESKINTIIQSMNYYSTQKELTELKKKIDKNEDLEKYEKSKKTYLTQLNKKIKSDLNDKIMSKLEIEKLIEIIGEPLIKNKLTQMLNSN